MKRIFSLVCLITLVLSLVGCTNDSNVIEPENSFYYDKIDNGIEYAENTDDITEEQVVSKSDVEIPDELKELLTKNVLEIMKRTPCVYPIRGPLHGFGRF